MSKIRIKIAFYQFLCGLFKHRWKYIETTEPGIGISFKAKWRFCKRCAKAEYLGLSQPDHPRCKCIIEER